MLHTTDKIIKHKVGLLNLAAELGNVSNDRKIFRASLSLPGLEEISMITAKLRLLSASLAAIALSGCLTLPGVGVGVNGGTTGIGAEVKANPLPAGHLILRGGYNYLEFSGDLDSDGINYDADVKLDHNLSAIADFSPLGGLFYLSGGAYFGDKGADILATPSTDVVIGGTTFAPEQVGSLVGRADYNDFAPYAGIALDNFTRSSGSWSFNARAGIMFVGSPDVSLVSVDGLLSSDPALISELQDEIQQIEDDAEDYKYYPVLTLGVTRRF